MDKARLSLPAREVLSRGYRQVTQLEAHSDQLQRLVLDPRNTNRNRDAKALGTVKFHQKVLLATIAALEASGSAK